MALTWTLWIYRTKPRTTQCNEIKPERTTFWLEQQEQQQQEQQQPKRNSFRFQRSNGRCGHFLSFFFHSFSVVFSFSHFFLLRFPHPFLWQRLCRKTKCWLLLLLLSFKSSSTSTTTSTTTTTTTEQLRLRSAWPLLKNKVEKNPTWFIRSAAYGVRFSLFVFFVFFKLLFFLFLGGGFSILPRRGHVLGLFFLLLDCSASSRVLTGFTEFYRVLRNFTKSYKVLRGFTGFYRVFTGFYKVLLGFT